ncbi:GNAT family N-acetyltransferase [Pleionea sp. CnH1-48]|uniref:GNAT family N-acetyltransferase n=1 Tax=Pleionea sp. CnH1-48 TaxID=2954494 RepID=UPI002096ABB4|nr:GNAT family N-acetyltransferase [Pleionea sp. CnH1-48]MCO7222853.1 GNAT family N-acetyltransferase [Pleionea sp. CnH1-48]
MSEFSIRLLTNEEVRQNIPSIARLRIDIFSEYPYLYQGGFDYESKYLSKFNDTPDSIIVTLSQDNTVVGAITGLPLQYEDDDVQSPWQKKEGDVASMYYFSEILLYPRVRGRGYGKRLFQFAEEAIQELGRYSEFLIATVIREDDHPGRPENYSSLEPLWRSLGYEKRDDKVCHISWREIGEESESDKPLVFWRKSIQ